MLMLRCLSETRVLVPHRLSSIKNTHFLLFFSSSSDSYLTHKTNENPLLPESTRAGLEGLSGGVDSNSALLGLKEWFNERNNPLLDQICKILRAGEEGLSGVGPPEDSVVISRQSVDSALSELRLPVTEKLVLDVLHYCRDVISCLKFFDWAGRQKGFYHTRATYDTIFKIIWKANEKSLLFDYLDKVAKRNLAQNGQFLSTLVIGYSVARKPQIALQLLSRMRFKGGDLDEYAYHVLLNALVEENLTDAVAVIFKQMVLRGFENEVTYSILIKNFCKLNKLDEAESYVREALSKGWKLNGRCLGILIKAICNSKQEEKAGELLEEFRESGLIPMKEGYDAWMMSLVRTRKLDSALEFFRRKNSLEGYVPDVLQCNTLVHMLLRQNRLEEVYDLLMEMKELKISPDEQTMNMVLCLFYKGGMADFARELYSSRSDSGLSRYRMADSLLIDTLCEASSTDEAYSMMKRSIDLGYFPGRKIFVVLADALCREGKLCKMKELMTVSLERNVRVAKAISCRFISALCRAKHVEEAYLLHEEMNKVGKRASGGTYCNLIHGFIQLKRGDIAAKLLIEMQVKGHHPHGKRIFRPVIVCLCEMENPERQFWTLLDMQLSRLGPNREIYNFFMDGAGYAGKPELAREVYLMMVKSGMYPNLSSDILQLQSCLRSEKISDALNLFHDIAKRRKIGRKLANVMVVGLCQVNRVDVAIEILEELLIDKKVSPGVICYEELVRLLCKSKKFHTALGLLNGMVGAGHHISSFIGNTLLYHSVRSKDLYQAWKHWIAVRTDASYVPTAIDQLIDVIYSERMDQDAEEVEQVIRHFFPLSIYTYNMLLRRVAMYNMERAWELFDRLCQKGYKPDRYTYDILVHSFYKHGRRTEGKKLLEEMMGRGFHPSPFTLSYV